MFSGRKFSVQGPGSLKQESPNMRRLKSNVKEDVPKIDRGSQSQRDIIVNHVVTPIRKPTELRDSRKKEPDNVSFQNSNGSENKIKITGTSSKHKADVESLNSKDEVKSTVSESLKQGATSKQRKKVVFISGQNSKNSYAGKPGCLPCFLCGVMCTACTEFLFKNCFTTIVDFFTTP